MSENSDDSLILEVPEEPPPSRLKHAFFNFIHIFGHTPGRSNNTSCPIHYHWASFLGLGSVPINNINVVFRDRGVC